MKELDTQKAALTLGLLLGGLHALWSLLIFLGYAQMLIDYVFWMHMLSVPYQVTGFTINQAVILIAATFVVGYALGWVFAWLWNKTHK